VIEFSIGEVFDVTLVRTGREEQSFTGLTSTTITLTTVSYTPGAHEVDVFFNGALLATADYTETNSTTITLGFTPIASDQFRVIVGRAVNVTNVSRSQVGGALYPQTAAEIAAGVTPTDYGYAPGDVRRYGFNGDGGTTDNTIAFQAALNGNAGFCPVTVPNMGGYAKLTGRITAPANTHIILQNGAELRWTATTATGSTLLGAVTRPGIEVVGDNFKISGEGVIRGPSGAVFVAGELGIWMKGTDTSARKNGFTIEGQIEFRNWGYAGWVMQFVDHINASGFHAHTCAHIGWAMLSCNDYDIHDFECGNITPGDGAGQGAGFSLTHDSTDYHLDPNAATNGRLVANPFCQRGDVHDFTIYDVPMWGGADCHGAYDTHFYSFRTYNCRHPVSMGSSSGDAINYAGANNKAWAFYCTTKRRDGSATTITGVDRTGLNLNGGTVVPNDNPQAWDFVLDGYGDTVVSSNSIQAVYAKNAHIHHFTLTNWSGRGVDAAYGSGTISHGTFDNPASVTNSTCIRLDTSTSGVWNTNHCTHRVQSGLVAAEGLRIASGNARGLHASNDFGSATAPEVYNGAECLGASDITPLINVVDASITANAFSIAACGRAPRVRVYMNLAGAQTVADITGAFVGQRIAIHCNDSNLTFNRTNAALAGGANFTSSQYDVLELLCIATSGIKFVEVGRSANS
jgi:hypothetical protein